MTGAPLNFCLEEKIDEQYFLLNSFLKLAQITTELSLAVMNYSLTNKSHEPILKDLPKSLHLFCVCFYKLSISKQLLCLLILIILVSPLWAMAYLGLFLSTSSLPSFLFALGSVRSLRCVSLQEFKGTRCLRSDKLVYKKCFYKMNMVGKMF